MKLSNITEARYVSNDRIPEGVALLRFPVEATEPLTQIIGDMPYLIGEGYVLTYVEDVERAKKDIQAAIEVIGWDARVGR